MVDRVVRGGRLDNLAVMLSGLCLVHCLASVLLLGALSSAAAWLGNPLIHEVGLVLAIAFGAIALVGGAVSHRRLRPVVLGGFGLGLMITALVLHHSGLEAVLTMAGVALLASAHLFNRRALTAAEPLPHAPKPLVRSDVDLGTHIAPRRAARPGSASRVRSFGRTMDRDAGARLRNARPI